MSDFIDDSFRCEIQRWGTWNSYDKDGNPLVTSLTEEECIKATRFILQLKQEQRLDKVGTTYNGSMDYKL